MSAIAKLATKGLLIRIEIELDRGQQPWRSLYGTTNFVDWLHGTLPCLETSVIGGDTTPGEQVDALLFDFVRGAQLNFGRQFRQLRPSGDAVWELKTIDIRIFGWFPEKDCFVATYAAPADRVKDHNLYTGYRQETVRIRSQLGTSFVLGSEADDVISVCA